jgi:hypothetical protein
LCLEGKGGGGGDICWRILIVGFCAIAGLGVVGNFGVKIDGNDRFGATGDGV